ncbi:MAG: SDR family oxidoreductase [Symploca sp. SIO3C6]|uniref:SDR family oxidoreductase n=1 Tax=Symploca sp. SIO1C4 TaxID=2607765 RepID=A0A6B3N7A8_9CYAN|nr:SDR family oxidoreductase [Symploca sp. SIO3C6]NER26705.1 SDR family oxidoreductase [Symploca sp. SIO1C4]NET08196.1 SDR family oxidoreductase [Symploca sp. SIO2B6]
MFESLSGKKVVIIGTDSGVALTVAKQTIELGASVVLSHDSQDKLNQAMESLSGEIEAKTVDILNEDSVNAFFEQVGNFDHLIVTSVGDRNMPKSLLAEMTTETAQGAMEKFWGIFFVVRASLKNIATNGSITLTSSVSIFKPSKMGGISAIAAANGAVATFGRLLALELSPIRVNVIASGLIEDTSIWSSQSESERSDLTKWATAALPVQHLGQPEELAQAMLSLITNPYVTGVILPVDGGVTML